MLSHASTISTQRGPANSQDLFRPITVNTSVVYIIDVQNKLELFNYSLINILYISIYKIKKNYHDALQGQKVEENFLAIECRWL